MKEAQYHYLENGKTFGPFTAEQLVKQITPETPIWSREMDAWQPARTVPQVYALFTDSTLMPPVPPVPPVAPPTFTAQTPPLPPLPAKRKSSKKWLVTGLVAVAGLVAAGGVVYDLQHSKKSINSTIVYDTSTSADATEVEHTASRESVNSFSNEYPYEFLLKRRVDYTDLAGLDLAELRIMRNYIFARHGYIFKSADLANYFSRYSWYNPRYSDVTPMLSEIEKQNVEFIKRNE